LNNEASGEMDNQQLVYKYSMLLASLLDHRFAWFYKDQQRSGQLQNLMIAEQDLETMIDYFRTACVKNDVKKPVIVNFLDFLASRKAELCGLQEPKKMQKIETGTKGQAKTTQNKDSLIETLEHQQKFELLI